MSVIIVGGGMQARRWRWPLRSVMGRCRYTWIVLKAPEATGRPRL